MNATTTLPFKGTEQQEAALRGWLREHLDTPGVAMAALQQAQEIYGYLPLEVQRIIAHELDKPLAEIYGVATFYSQFSLTPKGEHRVSVCLGTACYVKGSGVIFERLEEMLGIHNGEMTPDGKFSLDSCRCVGACGLAPVMMVGDDVYGRLSGDDNELNAILNKY